MSNLLCLFADFLFFWKLHLRYHTISDYISSYHYLHILIISNSFTKSCWLSHSKAKLHNLLIQTKQNNMIIRFMKILDKRQPIVVMGSRFCMLNFSFTFFFDMFIFISVYWPGLLCVKSCCIFFFLTKLFQIQNYSEALIPLSVCFMLVNQIKFICIFSAAFYIKFASIKYRK